MTTQNVKMSGAVKQFEAMHLSANTKGIRNSKAASFDSVMEQSTKKQDAAPMKKIEEKLQSAEAKPLSNSEEQGSDVEVMIQDKMDQTEETAFIKNEQKAVEDLTKTVTNAVEEIADKIQEVLGISKEELESVMELLGISFIDLQQPGVLQQLVTQVCGDGDISNLLTNEEMAGKLGQLAFELGKLFETYKDLLNSSELPVISKIPTDLVLKEGKLQELRLQDEAAEEQPIVKQDNGKNQVMTSGEETILNKNSDEVQTRQDSLSGNSQEDANDGVNEIQFQVKKVGTTSGMDHQSQGNGEGKNGEPKTMADGLNQFIQNLAGKTVSETTFTEQTANIQDIREITRQITEQIRITIRPTQTEMEMQLNPERLGKIQLSITSKAGVMTAHFTTETQVAKEAIESQLQMFQENIVRQGLKVDAIEVTVGTFDFAQSDGAGSGKKEQKQNRKAVAESLDVDGFGEVSEADSVLLDMMEQSGNTVDYSA